MVALVPPGPPNKRHHGAVEISETPGSSVPPAFDRNLTRCSSRTGLYAHRHHTHPLTTGALQNGQNGAKRVQNGAKRCKTVQNGCKMGAKWVQIV